MMGRKQKLDGDGHDAVTGWRRLFRWRAGERHQIKRRLNKAFRRAARLEISRSVTN